MTKVFQLEEDLVRARVSRKWYLVVIVLLYIGLLASFSLNVTLLMRKPVLSQVRPSDTDYGEQHPFGKLYSKLEKLDYYRFTHECTILIEYNVFSCQAIPQPPRPLL